MKIDNAKAIVTGAAGGLGGAFALELVRAGARVAAGDTNAAGLRKLAADAEGLPGEVFVAKLDITDEASVAEFVATAAERMDGLNVLVNSAGIARDGLHSQSVGKFATTGAIPAIKSAASHPTRRLIIPPFEAPVRNTRERSTTSSAANCSIIAMVNATSS